jgi:serine/threonine-protein kinase
MDKSAPTAELAGSEIDPWDRTTEKVPEWLELLIVDPAESEGVFECAPPPAPVPTRSAGHVPFPSRGARGSEPFGCLQIDAVSTYLLVRQIAVGGMGEVYEGRHQLSGERVAVKRVRAELADDPDVARRFASEAEAALRIMHPGVVEVLESGHDDGGRAYFVMEYLDGQTLATCLEQNGVLPVTEVAKIGAELAETLAAAHSAGVIHRDIKPANIVLCSKGSGSGIRVKLLDFGVAKIANTFNTRLGRLIGTPWYMSPEQVGGAKQADPRSDIYSLGCVLYEMTCGRVPFSGDFSAVLVGHQHEKPLPPCYFRSVPRALEDLILRMLRKSPDMRPQTMAEIAKLLRGMPCAEDSSNEPPRIPTRRRQTMAMTGRGAAALRARRLLWWVVFGALLSALAGAAIGALARAGLLDWLERL